MKLKQFISAMLLAALFAPALFAQDFDITTESTDRGFLLTIPQFSVDSVTTMYSSAFNLKGWDCINDYVSQADDSTGLVSTYTVAPFYGDYKLTSSAGKPKITAIIQGTNDPSDSTFWKTVATICTTDSTETLVASTLSISRPYFTYRVKINGTAANRADTYFKGAWYLAKARKP